MLFKLLLVVFVLLLVFGARRISQLGRGVGEGIRNFKKGLDDDERDAESSAGPSKTDRKRSNDES
jgi:sec-independent protein translocase protein TatA